MDPAQKRPSASHTPSFMRVGTGASCSGRPSHSTVPSASSRAIAVAQGGDPAAGLPRHRGDGAQRDVDLEDRLHLAALGAGVAEQATGEQVDERDARRPRGPPPPARTPRATGRSRGAAGRAGGLAHGSVLRSSAPAGARRGYRRRGPEHRQTRAAAVVRGEAGRAARQDSGSSGVPSSRHGQRERAGPRRVGADRQLVAPAATSPRPRPSTPASQCRPAARRAGRWRCRRPAGACRSARGGRRGSAGARSTTGPRSRRSACATAASRPR